MNSKWFYLKILVVVLIILSSVNNAYFPNTYANNLSYIDNDASYVLVEKNKIGKSFTSYLYKDSNNKYLSKIYDCNTHKELNITDLIKEDKIDAYNEKINELLTLKYPNFITDVLKTGEGTISYLLRDNELVIYYEDFQIKPEVSEDLFLRVNYNEIKDFVNFTVLLDATYENENGYNYNKSKKSIAITFDDSPNKGKTTNILNYLSDNHFHATFFVLGNKSARNKDLLINIKNSGNEIGSHTYSHQNMNKMTDDEIINDYNEMNNIYKEIFNEDLKLIRPPYGNIKTSKLNLIPASFILWSLDTNDWRYRNKDYLINYVIDNVQDGDIILFHDSYESTVKAIEELLPILYSKGYQVMSVSELFNLKGINLEENMIYHKAR